jgi:hypothetical protein
MHIFDNFTLGLGSSWWGAFQVMVTWVGREIPHVGTSEFCIVRIFRGQINLTEYKGLFSRRCRLATARGDATVSC